MKTRESIGMLLAAFILLLRMNMVSHFVQLNLMDGDGCSCKQALNENNDGWIEFNKAPKFELICRIKIYFAF